LKLFDLRHPFFLPHWRRVATTGVTGVWALFELVSGSLGWAMLFGGISAYCAYEFFVIFDPEHYREKEND